MAYLFFLSMFCYFYSTYLIVLFSLLYSTIDTLLYLCFPVGALVSFVLEDIIFGFLCLLGQSIVLYFLLDTFNFAYGCVCICVYSVTLFILVINLCLYTGIFQFCGVFFYLFFLFSFFFNFFPFFYNFIFLNLSYFSTFFPLFAFLTVLFPLKLIFHVHKSSSSTSI